MKKNLKEIIKEWATITKWFRVENQNCVEYDVNDFDNDWSKAEEVFRRLKSSNLLISDIEMRYDYESYTDFDYATGESFVHENEKAVHKFVILNVAGEGYKTREAFEVEYSACNGSSPVMHVFDILYAMLYWEDKKRFYLSLKKLSSKVKYVPHLEEYLDTIASGSVVSATGDAKQSVNDTTDATEGDSLESNTEEDFFPMEKDLLWIKGDSYEEKLKNAKKIRANLSVWVKDAKKRKKKKYVSDVLDKLKTEHVKRTKLITYKPTYAEFCRVFEGVFEIGESSFKQWDIIS